MEADRPVSMAPGLGVDGFFTDAELAVADQLVQLSVSGGAEAAAPTSSSLSARSVNNTEMKTASEMADQLVQLSGAEMASPTSSSLSARSVNNTEMAAAGKEDDRDDGVVDRRARKRYRQVAELYEATRPAKRGGAGGKRRREGRRDQHQIDRRSSWVCL